MRDFLRDLYKLFINHPKQPNLFCSPLTEADVHHIIALSNTPTLENLRSNAIAARRQARKTGKTADKHRKRIEAVKLVTHLMERICDYLEMHNRGTMTYISQGAYNVVLRPTHFPLGTCINNVVFRVGSRERQLTDLEKENKVNIYLSTLGCAPHIFCVGSCLPKGEDKQSGRAHV